MLQFLLRGVVRRGTSLFHAGERSHCLTWDAVFRVVAVRRQSGVWEYQGKGRDVEGTGDYESPDDVAVVGAGLSGVVRTGTDYVGCEMVEGAATPDAYARVVVLAGRSDEVRCLDSKVGVASMLQSGETGVDQVGAQALYIAQKRKPLCC